MYQFVPFCYSSITEVFNLYSCPAFLVLHFASNWKKSDGSTADALNIIVFLSINCRISWTNSSYIEEQSIFLCTQLYEKLGMIWISNWFSI